MSADYYKIMKVPRDSGEDEIRQSYRKLAMKWHPDKHSSETKVLAETKFKQISEAYQVLSDPDKRRAYDLINDEAASSSRSSATPSTKTSSTTSTSTSTNNTNNNATSFAEYYAKMYPNNPLRHPNEIFEDLFRHRTGFVARGSIRNDAPIEKNLFCTLEDLYKGSSRKMTISRDVLSRYRMPITEKELFKIEIKAGWKHGTKIIFSEKGHHILGVKPGDVIFIINERAHPTFRRVGDDLVMLKKISLAQAFTEKTFSFTTLDGRNLNIDISDFAKHGCEVVAPGEGMPISKEPGRSGNLRIVLDIMFPLWLLHLRKLICL